MATMTTAADHKRLALLCQYEEEYGHSHLRTYVVLPQEDGTFHGVSREGFREDLGQEYDGLRVEAWVGNDRSWRRDNDDPDRGVWGTGVRYVDVAIKSADQATAIAKVLSRLAKGLAAITEDRGYASDTDYAEHVERVARALRISRIYVRCHARHAQISGHQYELANGRQLRNWVDVAECAVKDGRHSELLKI